MAAWWKEWRAFMFEKSVTINDKKEGKKTTTPAKMLPPIKRAKYPAVTEAEEAISVPLQALLRSTARAVALLRPTASPSAALPFGRRVRAPRQLRPTRMRPTRRCMAIFDAILMHIVSECSPDGTWLKLKLQMLEKLYAKKDQRIIDIIYNVYADADVVFLQEVRSCRRHCRGSRSYSSCLGCSSSRRSRRSPRCSPRRAAAAPRLPRAMHSQRVAALAAAGPQVATDFIRKLRASELGSRYVIAQSERPGRKRGRAACARGSGRARATRCLRARGLRRRRADEQQRPELAGARVEALLQYGQDAGAHRQVRRRGARGGR